MKLSENKKSLTLVIIILAGAGVYYFSPKKTLSIKATDTFASTKSPSQKMTLKEQIEVLIKKSNAPVDELNQYPNIDEETKKSFLVMSSLVKEAITGELPYNDFIQSLEDMELRPTQMINENTHTGRMSIVRTQNILPGTRYLHAQYFSDEGTSDKAYLQHVSFELRPGPDSFRMAKEIIAKQFKITSKPKNENENYISWNIDNKRLVWVKKMSKEDLKIKDPYNSYDPAKDAGTIVVTIEEEIH